jgi:formate-dependent nitrite reductase cytochrome c552 subunit
LDFPLPAPTQGEEEIVDDQNCVDCHSDEEMLKAMAKPEEEGTEILSEGEG